jgi:hypothetical protein
VLRLQSSPIVADFEADRTTPELERRSAVSQAGSPSRRSLSRPRFEMDIPLNQSSDRNCSTCMTSDVLIELRCCDVTSCKLTYLQTEPRWVSPETNWPLPEGEYNVGLQPQKSHGLAPSTSTPSFALRPATYFSAFTCSCWFVWHVVVANTWSADTDAAHSARGTLTSLTRNAQPGGGRMDTSVRTHEASCLRRLVTSVHGFSPLLFSQGTNLHGLHFGK